MVNLRHTTNKCNDYAQIEGVVKYVRQQAAMLDSLARDQFIIKPKMTWLDLDKSKV